MQIPIALRRLGKAKKLVVTAGPAGRTRFDEPLIRAVARAHAWFEMLKASEAQSIAALARRSGLQRTYVSSLLPLAFLTPDITEAIVEGRQPATITLDRLITGPALPADWAAQRQLLGIR